MTLEEFIEEYYNNFEKNADGQIVGTVEQFAQDAIQEYLVYR